MDDIKVAFPSIRESRRELFVLVVMMDGKKKKNKKSYASPEIQGRHTRYMSCLVFSLIFIATMVVAAEVSIPNKTTIRTTTTSPPLVSDHLTSSPSSLSRLPQREVVESKSTQYSTPSSLVIHSDSRHTLSSSRSSFSGSSTTTSAPTMTSFPEDLLTQAMSQLPFLTTLNSSSPDYPYNLSPEDIEVQTLDKW
jgi:hypothetical protein